MKVPDRQIKISISKIINYEQPISPSSLSFTFISKKSGTIILTKNVEAFYQGNELLINANLKIQYSQDQSTIILRIAKTMGIGGQIILGQFFIDLQILKTKKTNLLSLGKGRGYLKIDQFYPKKGKHQSQRKEIDEDYGLQIYKKKNNIQQFIRARQQFLSKHTNTSRSKEQKSQVSKKFAQKVSNLLSQVKKTKERFRSNFNDYQNYQNESLISDLYQNKKFNYQIRTAKSQVNFKRNEITNNNSNRKYLKSQKNEQDSDRESNLSKGSSKSQKYVLFVNSLNLMPAEQFIKQERQKQRRSRRVNNFQRNQDYF